MLKPWTGNMLLLPTHKGGSYGATEQKAFKQWQRQMQALRPFRPRHVIMNALSEFLIRNTLSELKAQKNDDDGYEAHLRSAAAAAHFFSAHKNALMQDGALDESLDQNTKNALKTLILFLRANPDLRKHPHPHPHDNAAYYTIRDKEDDHIDDGEMQYNATKTYQTSQHNNGTCNTT